MEQLCRDLPVIRHLQTGKFYAYGYWTFDLQLAEKFPDLEAIQKIVAEHKMKDVEMLLISRDGQSIHGGVRVGELSL